MVASSQRSRFPPSRNYCSNVTNTQFRGTRKVQPSIPIHAINRSDSPGSILFSVFEINPWEYCWWKCYAILVQLFPLFLIFNYCSCSPYSTYLSQNRIITLILSIPLSIPSNNQIFIFSKRIYRSIYSTNPLSSKRSILTSLRSSLRGYF